MNPKSDLDKIEALIDIHSKLPTGANKRRIMQLIKARDERLVQSIQSKINEQMEAAKDNLQYHINRGSSRAVIKDWEGTVFGIKLIDEAVAKLTQQSKESE